MEPTYVVKYRQPDCYRYQRGVDLTEDAIEVTYQFATAAARVPTRVDVSEKIAHRELGIAPTRRFPVTTSFCHQIGSPVSSDGVQYRQKHKHDCPNGQGPFERAHARQSCFKAGHVNLPQVLYIFRASSICQTGALTYCDPHVNYHASALIEQNDVYGADADTCYASRPDDRPGLA